MNCVAVDLFCGIGGLTYGIQRTGIIVAAGIDIDPTCRYAYEKNNNSIFINKGVEKIKKEEIEAYYPKECTKILIGCAPCQPFSTYSLRYAKEGPKDEKWKLLYYFKNLAKGIQPEIISMENVPQLIKKEVFCDFVNGLKKEKYHVSWQIINCADYGVPQSRKRLVLLASKLGDIHLIAPLRNSKNYITVKDAIGNLPKIKDGEICEIDSLHRASKLSEINKKRIKKSVPGGTWKDWDESLQLSCHKKSTGKGYRAVYGRMEWDKPAPTITTQFYGYGNGRFGHPEQDRAISIREGAILQSFPPDYKFIDVNHPQTNRQIGIHIGNAVPVNLGEAIGKSILVHLKKYKEVKCNEK
jgi:DNA (cytosine-5)-methyltransferase 1